MTPAAVLDAAFDAARLDDTLAALADPHRRRVVDLLSERPRRSGDLARQIGLAPPAMSRHLKTLRDCGLVEERHDGPDARVRIYEPMAYLKLWLHQMVALWSVQLRAFRDHLAARAP